MFAATTSCATRTYVAPALAYDIAQCDGLVDMMSYWTFDDVFEEGGVPGRSLCTAALD